MQKYNQIGSAWPKINGQPKDSIYTLVQTGFEKKDDGITVINCPVIANLTASAPRLFCSSYCCCCLTQLTVHGGRMHDKEMACRTRPIITPQTQIFSYLSATFGPNTSEFFDICLHWVSVVHDTAQ